MVAQNKDLYIVRSPSFTFISLSMNPTRDPWKDDRIRQAAQHALDRQQFVDLIVGNGEGKPDGLVHWPTGPVRLQRRRTEYGRAPEVRPEEVEGADQGGDRQRHDQGQDHLPDQRHRVPQQAPADLPEADEGRGVRRRRRTPRTSRAGSATTPDVKYDASLSLNQIYETPEIALDWQHSKGPTGDSHFATGVGLIHPEVDDAIINSKKAKTLDDLVAGVRAAQDAAYKVGPSFLPIMSWYSVHELLELREEHPRARRHGDVPQRLVARPVTERRSSSTAPGG